MSKTEKSAQKWLQLLIPLLSSDCIKVFTTLWQFGSRVIAARLHEGLYEVLEYESCLELLDIQGSKAVLHKRQKVRFLQDYIIAYQDQAWGDGDIFADYQCSPGKAVDRYREGHRYRILISLRETKRRNDIDEFHITRTIRDGFTKEIEDFQTDIDHTTRKLSLTLIFPAKRFPKRVTLIEQHSTRHFNLGMEHQTVLPGGRLKVTWGREKPHLFEAYILRWEW